MRAYKWLGMVAAVFFLSGLLLRAADVIDYQKKVEDEAAHIDQAVEQAGGTVGEKLSDRFGLKPEDLQKTKDEQKSWGKTFIMYTLAQELHKAHPKDYPTSADSQKKVHDLLVENKKYEEITKQLEINLDNVLNQSKKFRSELQSQKRYPVKKKPNVP